MADNKEITTLHPYMNRNKNRYPNVKEENIPDTIQRKLTAGTGINITPENVISATGGDSYTRSETDALLDTKADKVALENVNKAVPTAIAVKDGKLGLEHDTTWLTNQNAITLGDGLAYDEATKTLKASGGGGSISVIELTGESGTIASAQLGEINANPQNFAFKYNGKILPFTKVDSTTYQYCNNTTNSSDNNVMTTSTLLTITSSTGAYTITENVHNVVANSIHPANGGDLTNIQVGSKVYSIPSGGGNTLSLYQYSQFSNNIQIKAGTYTKGQRIDKTVVILSNNDHGFSKIICATNFSIGTIEGNNLYPIINGVLLNVYVSPSIESGLNRLRYDIAVYTPEALTVEKATGTNLSYQIIGYK